MARLEGNRRALKGTLFEGLVRRNLENLIRAQELRLEVNDTQVKIDDETYDVQITGTAGTLLIPVKTRETMGGGHSLLFTRDIYKSIMVAAEKGNNSSASFCAKIGSMAATWLGLA